MYVEVSNALLSAGYLTDTDVDAAIVVLADALIVGEAEDAEAVATEDYAAQEDLIAVAEVWANEDISEGNYVSTEIIDEANLEAAARPPTSLSIPSSIR